MMTHLISSLLAECAIFAPFLWVKQHFNQLKKIFVAKIFSVFEFLAEYDILVDIFSYTNNN